MLILKRRLKNTLNNKILKTQLTPYNIFYIVIDNSQTLTKNFKTKNLTKALLFKTLRTRSYVYPVCTVPAQDLGKLLSFYTQITTHPEFKKILIANIQSKFLIFKNLKSLTYFHIQNSTLVFYKLYFYLKFILFKLNFIKNFTKL